MTAPSDLSLSSIHSFQSLCVKNWLLPYGR
jgi:hypothetical protein